MNRPTLCLDFDGVLHSYTSGWVSPSFIPDPPVPGAFEFLLKAIKHFDVQIYSSRSASDNGREAMRTWLEYWARKELPNDEASGWAANGLINFFNRTTQWPIAKPPAFVTIDDRAITFTGVWPEIETLKAFKPWNTKR